MLIFECLSISKKEHWACHMNWHIISFFCACLCVSCRPCLWLSCLLFQHPTSSSLWGLSWQREYFMFPVWASVFLLHMDSRWSQIKGRFLSKMTFKRRIPQKCKTVCEIMSFCLWLHFYPFLFCFLILVQIFRFCEDCENVYLKLHWSA